VVFNKSEQFYFAKCYKIFRWNLFMEMFVSIGHVAGVKKLTGTGRSGNSILYGGA
jgi:hypothetical protein